MKHPTQARRDELRESMIDDVKLLSFNELRACITQFSAYGDKQALGAIRTELARRTPSKGELRINV